MFKCIPCSKDGKNSTLYVVSVVSNPCRYASRYSLYSDYEKMVNDSGAKLITVETAYGNRPHVVTDSKDPYDVQLRTYHELWHKENMINIGISRLPSDWEYVAWIDADVLFVRPDWVHETINQLQHYKIVQMFSHAYDLGPDHDPFQRHVGFVYSYINQLKTGKDYCAWHPGFAWAARRETIDALGGLIDFAILGAADRHMAHCLVGTNQGFHRRLHDNYKKSVLLWQERAMQFVKKNVGYVPGTLMHYWHGKKRDRKYQERWTILVKNQYDPVLDLKKDWQGMYQLTDRNIKLRDDIMLYFRSRNEDSIDLDEQDIRL